MTINNDDQSCVVARAIEGLIDIVEIIKLKFIITSKSFLNF